MNQAAITANARSIQKRFRLGIQIAIMFGTDPRYIQSPGLRYGKIGTDLYQADIPEVYLSFSITPADRWRH